MKDQIKRLIKLQTIEIRVNKINNRLDDVGKKLKELDKRFESYEERIENDTAALEIKKKEYRDYDAEIQISQSMITKSRDKMKVVKTNREYRSMLKEIDELKLKISNMEEQMLNSLEQTEELEKEIEDRKKEFVQIGEEITAEKANVQSTAAMDNEKLVTLRQEWQCASEGIKPDILKKFSRVNKKVFGAAVVSVHNAVCQGCHMNIPPQTYNELQRCDSLKFCPHCDRIIYWQGL
ncbi:MAG: hypothetical protein JRI38_00920 [Deltaproteobacteria bacterium]|nr:hypothetical protein [Deltaproteobacteria bacterium]